ncbi:hypothetical protein ASC89_08120 [Devosia sp. Root413D1]|uniref:hypothetical protein n=1 Tax=Devosia sp. Root413D1 TaxID=1736531 RepID=UPI0006FFF5FB|nr:hypothetical protein [Devosia sp. Root413D1]KQW80065.1 hypothetical protein ASC89_08120 [Devosia sp. Root413D1]
MLRPLVLTIVAATLFAAGPAMARENCNLNDNLPGLKIEFGFSVGGKSGGDGDSFDQEVVKMELRRRGVDARSVSLASDGCVEAFVQYPDGTWHSDYYDPDTWEQVD